MRWTSTIVITAATCGLMSSCNRGQPDAAQTTSAAPASAAPPVSSQCSATTTRDPASGLPELHAMSGSGSLFGLVFGGYPARADGSTTKIAWRMTGSGPLVLVVIDPDGHRLPATFGPEPHTGSNWSRPGDEWGSGFTFTTPGCWTINATRLAAAASLQVLVVA